MRALARNPIRLVAASLLLVCTFLGCAIFGATSVRADSWSSPEEQEATSENGTWHVRVLPGRSWRSSRLILSKQDGMVTPTPSTGPEPRWKTVFAGSVHHPVELRVTNDGSVLLFEEWGSVGTGLGESIRLLGADGKRRWSAHGPTWLSESDWQGMMRTASNTWWYDGLWIDEQRDVLVVISTTTNDACIVTAVDLKTGKRAKSSSQMLLRGMMKGTEEERVLAIRAVRALKVAISSDVARAIFAAKEDSALVRVHAALVFAEQSSEARDYIGRMARGEKDAAARELAIRHLGEAEGKDAIPYLVEVLAKGTDPAWWRAVEALAEQGPSVVGPMTTMLLDEAAHLNARGAAVAVLGKLGSQARPALPALLRVAVFATDGASNAAINALREIFESEELKALYAALMTGPTGDDDLLALQLQREPSRDALAPLEAKLARVSGGMLNEADWYREAIAACRKSPALKPATLKWASAHVAEARATGR